MKKIFANLLLIAASAMMFASCDNPAKMAEAADQISIKCTPEVLEAVAGNIDATIEVTFPGKYFQPKAILEVTPVMLYHGGEVAGQPFYYQGEKVKDNYKVIAAKEMTTVRENVHFNFVPGMERSELVLRAKVLYNGKEYEYPADIKVADGVNTTYMLASFIFEHSAAADFAEDNYQSVINETAEAQILYLINSADVRNSELRGQDIKDYQAMLAALADDSRRAITGTEIVAYASPDGEIDHNNKLSANREKSATKALEKVTKKLEKGEVTSRSIGEDWDGFQELVSNSNIEDKDLILRVLSMYSDPNVREREIRNMSQVYKSLADEILPELRRARFITNIEYTNYTPEELTALVENNIDALDEEALLRAATLVKDNDAKLAIYEQAIKKFDSDRARYNAAVILAKKGDVDAAAKNLAGIADQNSNDVKNVKGIIALKKGDVAAAGKLFAEAGNKENAAVVDILNGKYNEAAAKLSDSKRPIAALANILTGDLAKANSILEGHNCPMCSYMKAIVAARQGENEKAKGLLEKAEKNETLKAREANDIEFIKVL